MASREECLFLFREPGFTEVTAPTRCPSAPVQGTQCLLSPLCAQATHVYQAEHSHKMHKSTTIYVYIVLDRFSPGAFPELELDM